jgi:hypothetical protein
MVEPFGERSKALGRVPQDLVFFQQALDLQPTPPQLLVVAPHPEPPPFPNACPIRTFL